MQTQTKVSVSETEGIGILEIFGDLTMAVEEPVVQAYHELTNAGKQKILLKFDEARYINSSGIAVIIGILSEARKKKQKVAACGLSNHFQKIFDIVGLTSLVKIYKNQKEALKNF